MATVEWRQERRSRHLWLLFWREPGSESWDPAAVVVYTTGRNPKALLFMSQAALAESRNNMRALMRSLHLSGYQTEWAAVAPGRLPELIGRRQPPRQVPKKDREATAAFMENEDGTSQGDGDEQLKW